MSLLDALGYVGDTLAKPGRAVRGVLAGRPDELANLIPFSDTMGLTDPHRQVRGRDLLNQMGVTDEADDGWGAMLGGFGADVLTDPLTYAGGALLRGGLKALSPGAVALTPELAAARAAEAAAGEFRLVDPIGQLANPADDVTRGWQTPWEPPTPPGGIDLPPLAPSPALSLDRPLPPITGIKELDAVPHPDAYSLGWGGHPDLAPFPEHWNRYLGPDQQLRDLSAGIYGDLLDDGMAANAQGVLFGTWDDALRDLGRLTPEARISLGAPGDLRPDLWQTGQTEMGNLWQSLLSRRQNELNAIGRLADEGAVDASYAAQAQAQLARLAPLYDGAARGEGQSALGTILGQLDRGWVRPGDIPVGTARGGLPPPLGNDITALTHYGADPAVLRRLAENGQTGRAMGEIDTRLGALAESYGPLGAGTVDDTMAPRLLADDLRQSLLMGGQADELGLDPAIIQRLVEHPPAGVPHSPEFMEFTERVAGARDLLPRAEAAYARQLGAYPGVRDAVSRLTSAYESAPGAVRPYHHPTRLARLAEALQQTHGVETVDDLAARLGVSFDEMLGMVHPDGMILAGHEPLDWNAMYVLNNLPRRLSPAGAAPHAPAALPGGPPYPMPAPDF